MKEPEDIIPVRITRSRRKGSKQVSPNGLPIQYVGRPTRWGNPFTEGDQGWRANQFREHLLSEYLCRDFAVEEIKAHLAGKNLSCWCAQDTPCHADVLLALANDLPIPEYSEERRLTTLQAALWLNVTPHRLGRFRSQRLLEAVSDHGKTFYTIRALKALRRRLWANEPIDPMI